MDRINKIFYPENSRPFTHFAKLSLKPPVILLLQMLESTLSSIGNITGVFRNNGIEFDPYYLLEQYMPGINWKDFKKEAEEYIAKRKVLTPPDPGGNN